MTLLLYGILLVAVLADFRSYKIPNQLIVFGICLGTLALGRTLDAAGLGIHLAKAAILVVLLLPFYILRALGAGDIKLLFMVSLFLGVTETLQALVLSALAGSVAGLIKLVVEIAKKKSRGEKYYTSMHKSKGILEKVKNIGVTKIHFSFYILIGVMYVLEVRR